MLIYLLEKTADWYLDRNLRQKGVDWQFTIEGRKTQTQVLVPGD